MQNVSSSYLEKIKEPSRSFECRVTIGNNVYTNIDIINISIEDVQPSDGFTINCRKAPFFRYGDIRQGFIKNVRKLVAN